MGLAFASPDRSVTKSLSSASCSFYTLPPFPSFSPELLRFLLQILQLVVGRSAAHWQAAPHVVRLTGETVLAVNAAMVDGSVAAV